MQNDSKEELLRLIQAYNDEMMSKYHDQLQRQNTAASKKAPKDLPTAVTEVYKAEEKTQVSDDGERKKTASAIEAETVSSEETNQEAVTVEASGGTAPLSLQEQDRHSPAAESIAPIKEETVLPIEDPFAEESRTATPQNAGNGFSDEEMEDRGYLQVRVSTENQAIPIENANVTVTHTIDENVYLDRTMITDEDGLTPIIPLYTKNRDLSLTPGNTKPYTSYTIAVTADGYYPERFVDVPIYGGVTSVQSVNLIPLAEGGDDDMVLIYPETGPTDL